jgi:hypothetical protein
MFVVDLPSPFEKLRAMAWRTTNIRVNQLKVQESLDVTGSK